MSVRSWKINDIFYSLQGEGYFTGVQSVFVRFSGCNLHCNFCDTAHQSGLPMSTEEIVTEILRYPAAQQIVLTGGEPAMHITAEFIATLKAETGLRITIETNGTRLLPEGIDWVTLSPKFGFAGGDNAPCILDQCDELKVVYIGQDLTAYDHITAQHRYLQPCFSPNTAENQANTQACVQAVLTNPGWRLSLQTHRYLCIP